MKKKEKNTQKNDVLLETAVAFFDTIGGNWMKKKTMEDDLLIGMIKISLNFEKFKKNLTLDKWINEKKKDVCEYTFFSLRK